MVCGFTQFQMKQVRTVFRSEHHHGFVLPGAVQVNLAGVQLYVFLLIKDAVDDRL